MALMSIKGLIDTLNDSDMSFGDKLISTFTQLGFILPNLGYSINTIKTLFGPNGIIGSFIASKTALESLNTSYGKSTADRANNVQTAAAYINGTVLYPGQTFSTIKVIKDRTEENGYKAAAEYSGKIPLPCPAAPYPQRREKECYRRKAFEGDGR